MATNLSDFPIVHPFPVDHPNKMVIICPKGTIQLALSEYRKSNATDEELAGYISELLAMIMISNSFQIQANKRIQAGPYFHYLSFEPSTK
jgi:hypothetical protein